MTVLEPLAGFNYSNALDLNASGVVVGSSYESTGPAARATEWTGGSAAAISTSPNRSESLKIIDSGEILYVEYSHPHQETGATYYLRAGGTSTPLTSSIPDLAFPIDFSDTRRVLCGVRDGAGKLSHVIHDLNDGSRVLVPEPTPAGNQFAWRLYGMDNAGRVLGSFSRSGGPYETKFDLMWLPAGGTSWNVAGLTTTNLTPNISKDGFVVSAFDDGSAAVLDLRAAAPVLKKLPVFKSSTNPAYNIAFGANAAGYVVGTDSWSAASLYDPTTGANSGVATLFPSDYDPTYARTINDAGFAIGYGTHWTGPLGTPNRTGKTRAWLNQLVGGITQNPIRIPGLVAEILWGVTQDGGGLIFVPGRGPIPVPPWTPKLSAERMDVLTGLAVGQLAESLTDPEMKAVIAKAEQDLLKKGINKLKGK